MEKFDKMKKTVYLAFGLQPSQNSKLAAGVVTNLVSHQWSDFNCGAV